MGRNTDILVGLDLGTTKITVAVAERTSESPGEARIIGIGEAPSRGGIRKGMIRDLALAVNAVSDAIADAESSLRGLKISSVVVAFSGQQVACRVVHGHISLGRTPRPILESDMSEVIEDALSELRLPAEVTCLHAIPIGYTVDGSSDIDNPVEMTGTRLEVELAAIVVPTTVVMNVVNCVEKAGVKVSGLVVKPLAEALGILSEDDRQIGATFISVGGGTTSVAVFSEGHLRHAAEFPIGGDHVTSDVTQVLQVPPVTAEEIKRRVDLTPGKDSLGTITVETRGRKVDISMEDLTETVAGRLDELFADIVMPSLNAVKNAGLPTEVVMAGGVMLSRGIKEFASEKLQMNVRIGIPVMSHSMQRERNDCRYGALCGVIVYLLEKIRNPFAYVDAPVSDFKNPVENKITKRKSVIKREKRDSEKTKNTLARNIKELIRQLF